MSLKKVILFFALGLIAFASNAQQQKTPEATTQAQVAVVTPPGLLVKEETYDFGKIPQGKPVHHSFTVQNIGNTPLKISNVVASCGCTTPEWEKDASLAPGASTQINVGYNAAAEGAFHKNITITYNDNQSKIINIMGEVWKAPASSAPENQALNDLKD